MKKFLSLSEYMNQDHPISSISLTGKIASIEAIPTNEEVPEIQGYIKPMSINKGVYDFNTTIDVTPYFNITKDSSTVYKYIDSKETIINKTQLLQKTVSISAKKETGNTYIGSIYITEISSIPISSDELFSTFVKVSSVDSEIDKFSFYIDHINRLFYVFVDARSNKSEINIKLQYSEIFMTAARTNDYFVIPYISQRNDTESYVISYNYYSILPGINTSYNEMVFNGILDSTSYRRTAQITSFKPKFYNSYYDGRYCEFIIFNKYEYQHEPKVIEFKNSRYPSYVLCGNNDSKSMGSNSILKIELDIVYSGDPILLDEIEYNVGDIYIIENNTDKIYSATWDYVNKSIVFPSALVSGSYTVVVSVIIPNSMSYPLSYNGITNFSLYNSNLLYETIYYINYDSTSDKYIMLSSNNEKTTGQIGFVTQKNKYDYRIYASDIRSLNKEVDDQNLFSGNIGSSPMKYVMHPMDQAEYIEIKMKTSENYTAGIFDIDTRTKEISNDIISKKPFNKIIEINSSDQMSRDLVFECDVRLEEYLFLLNFKFMSSFASPNLQFYVKIDDEIYKKAFYEALSIDKPYYNTLKQPVFDNNISSYRTFSSYFTLLYNPVMLDISKDKIGVEIDAVKEITFEYGIYNRRYNLITKIGQKTITISTDGYSSEGFAHDKFGV